MSDASDASNTNASKAGDDVIDLGELGQLIKGVQVEGKWYYVLDVNRDGAHGVGDSTTHDALDAVFRYNAAGQVETEANAVGLVGDTDDTFRYATLGGLRLALPTQGVNVTMPNRGWANLAGTAVASAQTTNSRYDDLLAIWDAYNGNGQDVTNVAGVPAGWLTSAYWSATTNGSSAQHAMVDLGWGTVYGISSAKSVSFAEGGNGTAYQTKASDGDLTSKLSYRLGGTDAALFNIDANSGAVSFKAVPNFQRPMDSGKNNVYDITVTASDGVKSSAAQAVAITVTDIARPLAGDKVISLGDFGNLINGVNVEGKWYYVVDFNKNGVHDGGDYFNQDALRRDYFRFTESGYDMGSQSTPSQYSKWATINGVKLALPERPFSWYQAAGTAINDPSQINPTYDDLQAIWDAFNGSSTGMNLHGAPPGWLAGRYTSSSTSLIEFMIGAPVLRYHHDFAMDGGSNVYSVVGAEQSRLVAVEVLGFVM
ncbi:cadherin repeat domain-containing protein [Hydrogenophaga sp.]|uniref:cadherin repeat domain-containing protein n=1 Tax=Hydrogenophaga sp. TaxID=1904254 RepID=UPI0026138F1B|nr:cadherin repeat domain-containing protein [Hydrogenophaga sp.]MCW5653674.1 cadherin repeat domain-containing protein [Hydrogenophaga sp.]